MHHPQQINDVFISLDSPNQAMSGSVPLGPRLPPDSPPLPRVEPTSPSASGALTKRWRFVVNDLHFELHNLGYRKMIIG